MLVHAARLLQVLIREGPELAHRFITPLVRKAQHLLGIEVSEEDEDLRALTEEISKLHARDMEQGSSLGLLPTSRTPSPYRTEGDVRLV